MLRIQTAVNTDPNTFDRTLVTLRNGTNVFTFKVDDLKKGALYLPEYGAAILPDNDRRDYSAVAEDVRRAGQKTLYDRIAEMPEQTWTSAWNGMPPKKSRIAFVLGNDGGRQKFRLDADGNVSFRWDDQYMKGLPAQGYAPARFGTATDSSPVRPAGKASDTPHRGRVPPDLPHDLGPRWRAHCANGICHDAGRRRSRRPAGSRRLRGGHAPL